MKQQITYRRAEPEDSRFIAQMIELASDGIASLEWEQAADPENGVSAIDVGAERYAQNDGDYSYENCIIAQADRPVGVILSFPITDKNYSHDAKPPPYEPDEVFAPYEYLEARDSWYICGIGLIPEYRRQGLGEQLIKMTIQHASEAGYHNLSLVAVRAKTGLIDFYRSLGFKITRSAPIVEHPGIRAHGEAVLMETCAK